VNIQILVFLGLVLAQVTQVQAQSTSVDSFEINKDILESNYEIEYEQFDAQLEVLSKHGDIHQYVLQSLYENRRTPISHDDYPAFVTYICNNMDSSYRKGIQNMIESDSLQRYVAYPLVKSCLFKTNEETCIYLRGQNFEEKFTKSNSLLFESLIKLKDELNCGF